MQTVRQTFTILKQNPLLSTISILGTAFAITMIMAIVIIWQTKYADLEPEVNRSRCLYFSAMHISSKIEEGVQNYNTPSPAFMKECIQPLSEVEACTAFVPASAALVSLTDGSNRVKVDAMQTDQGFWKVFSLQFMAGHGFGEEDRAGGTKAVVVCASVARKLFGTTDAVGQQLLLNREPARVIGVVKDVSVTAKDAYAQVWSMYPADKLEVTSVWSYGGSVHIAVLARTSDDDTFWHVFDFSFVAGKAYDRATFDAGLPVAVITESVARRLFQTTEAVGREFLLNHAPYTVAGVVKDVSTLANTAYAQVWVPYTSTEITKDTWSDEHMGMMSVTILAKSREDFPAIREETERRRQEYNTIIGENGYSLIYRNRPYDQEKSAAGMAANIEPDVDQARRQRLIIFIILLIVPAINLSSMTQSRLRQRVAEIGVRRAFGSTRLELMRQIIAENLVVTLLAGILGLLLSVVFAYLGNTLLFAQEFSQTLSPPAVDASILLHGSTFGWALLFCFVLNLLSSGIPAWRASRVGIVNALGGRLHK